MSWDPTCNSVGVHVNTPADVMVAPDGNVPSNENVKVLTRLSTTSVSEAVASKGELYKFACALVTDGI